MILPCSSAALFHSRSSVAASPWQKVETFFFFLLTADVKYMLIETASNSLL